jgi:hypothetical protein
LPPALERLFIAFARTLRMGIVSGQGSTGHGPVLEWRNVQPCLTRSAQPRQDVGLNLPPFAGGRTAKASSSLLARFSLLRLSA